ncbi:hypothetical protein [Flavobacterium notoginsengisoli]|uniref:hypothetical protein n=1 Tax=Flavobacterium notoginsengisoli TaxID=1478199 RepID=UPI00362B23FC
MSNDLVAYSRAGDVFHYRWAARRCLALVHPNSELTHMVIEGSDPKQDQKEGEYVIDVSEYYEQSGRKRVKYYQLKHTTVQMDSPFTLSDLEETIIGFSNRFCEHMQQSDAPEFSFAVVTNRPINAEFKSNILLLAKGKKVPARFRKTIEGYTGLKDTALSKFCSLLGLNDGEGSYHSQKDSLRMEMAHLLAGTPDNSQIESLVAMVQERVLPKSARVISREDVLKRFDVYFEKDLFPAPALWENSVSLIGRAQHESLIKEIAASDYPVIVHAPGGVGKSVFCRQLADSLPIGSFAVAYDCFGAGKYRSSSGLRHRHRDALVQIVNEMAVKGLCDPLLVTNTSQDSDIMKKFLIRIASAVETLQKAANGSELFILIDAADNAEMAAKEYSSLCFASELLREDIPKGCRLVMLCRTERIEILKPISKIVRLELEGFSENETLQHLKLKFPDAGKKEAREFHRLTSGNPRVQSNSLNVPADAVSELLARLGPSGKSVEELIEKQLREAVSSMKDLRAELYHEQIDAICVGLSSLPPHIPLEILAVSAGVSASDVRSFVYDIGRSLWLTDNAVQFRDEPTETWFRKTFLAEKKNFESYVNLLEPLASKHTYVAEVLPQLYLQAEKYDKLIEMALSDDLLPENNPIDARNVRVYRLQFAFRAAIRTGKINDAVRIAILAGEHSAGSERQNQLFEKNLYLLAALQDKEKVQEIAFKRLLHGGWNGSENIYTASLLSGIEEYKGEAAGYYRSAINWIQIYYEEHKKRKEKYHRSEVSERDVTELAYACFNIYGEQECVALLNRFKPKTFIFSVVMNLAKRLIDQGNFAAVDSFLQYSRLEPYYIIAIADELLKVGRYPQKNDLEDCLKMLASASKRIKMKGRFYENEAIVTAVISFLEVAIHRGLPAVKIRGVLEHYMPQKAGRMVSNENQFAERSVFLRATALKNLIDGRPEMDLDALMPDELLEKKKSKNYQYDNDISSFNEKVGGMYPWYLLRARIIMGQEFNFKQEIKDTAQQSSKARGNRYRAYDILPRETAAVHSSILAVYNVGTAEEVQWFYTAYMKDNKAFGIKKQIETLRSTVRLKHLSGIKDEMEIAIYNTLTSITDEGPEDTADRYMLLADVVLIASPQDAAVYFEQAVDIVSKFGDEIVRRWEAVIGLANQVCLGGSVSEELAYRFIRCAELVGNYVDREKYWERSEASALCAKMSHGTGIAALSRWRDRNIGRFEIQLEALLTEVLESGSISPAAGWAMCRFFSEHQKEGLLRLCLEKEADNDIKQKLFEDAVRLVQMQGGDAAYWRKIIKIAKDHKIASEYITELQVLVPEHKEMEIEPLADDFFVGSQKKKSPMPWTSIFGSLDILNAEQFEKCRQAYQKKAGNFYQAGEFWSQTVVRLTEKNLWTFIDMLMLSADISRYDLKSFLDAVPAMWKEKASFRKNRILLLKAIGRKFALELSSRYGLKYFLDEFGLDGPDIELVKQGIFEGLGSGYEFSDAETYFGFACLAAPMIAPAQAAELLDFAVSRFEIHMEDGFADGNWDSWLKVEDGIENQIAGFIWSALGSPSSKQRWNAAHAVRVLGSLGCQNIIAELMKCLDRGTAGAFSSREFPFYNLHARLYLLFALARISLDNPQILREYTEMFIGIAKGQPHIIIQKTAADTVINLAAGFPDLCGAKILETMKYAAKSKLPLLQQRDGESVESWWHLNDQIIKDYSFYFSHDFDSYWFEPLGSAFGISARQTEQIAATVLVNDWRIDAQEDFGIDPRQNLWSRSSKEMDTWHDHSSYPLTDNLEFYYSYHSLMAAASMLLDKMPLVIDRYSVHSEWKDWLSGHLLTCRKGKWLSDYRDAVPMNRPQWTEGEVTENWQENISENEFYEALCAEKKDGIDFFNVRGGWEEISSGRSEKISFSSAMVSKDASQALLRALESCEDDYSSNLPDYNEKRMEIHSDIFQLKGWIKSRNVSKALDELDPYADNISYPCFAVGKKIARQLELSKATEHGQWILNGSQIPDLKYTGWSSYRTDRDRSPTQSGGVMTASITLLLKICRTYDYDLIFKVNIKRDDPQAKANTKEKQRYTKPKAKFFILSSDGEIRTAAETHRTGEKDR